MNLQNLSPRQKKILVALLAAGGLALVVLISRRGSGAAAAPDAGQLGAIGTPTGVGSTFADNGEAVAGLSTSLTQGFGDLQSSIEQLPTTVAAAVTPIEQPSSSDIAGALVAALVTAGMTATPSGAQTAASKAASATVKAPTPPQIKAATKAGAAKQKAADQHAAAVRAAKKKRK